MFTAMFIVFTLREAFAHGIIRWSAISPFAIAARIITITAIIMNTISSILSIVVFFITIDLLLLRASAFNIICVHLKKLTLLCWSQRLQSVFINLFCDHRFLDAVI